MRVKLPITPQLVTMLFDMQRIAPHQKADPLAIGMAVSELLKDMVKSGLQPDEFFRREWREFNKRVYGEGS